MKFMPPGATGAKSRKVCMAACVSAVFRASTRQHLRFAVLEAADGSLLLRSSPEDEEGQDRMHNEYINALRISVRQVLEARV